MDNDKKVKLLVTMTTTKFRLSKIKPVLIRIIKEQLEVEICSFIMFLFLPMNLKDKIPEWLEEFEKANNNFNIKYCEKDYGPITKLFPFILNLDTFYDSEYINECVNNGSMWITTIDDDILYDTKFIRNIINIISLPKKSKIPENFVNHALAFSCVKWNPTTNMFYPSIKYTPINSSKDIGQQLILEGYMGVVYNLSCFYPFTEFINYVNNTSGKNQDCFRSDDFVISYFINMKNNTFIEQVFTHEWNKTKFWNDRRNILTNYSQNHDALHSNNSSFERYKKAADHIQKIVVEKNLIK